jgi:hypothetical protein
MWCAHCAVQYCLYCGEAAGTLVKWHSGQSCEDYLASVARSKADAERQKLAAAADAECAAADSLCLLCVLLCMPARRCLLCLLCTAVPGGGACYGSSGAQGSAARSPSCRGACT